MKTYIILKENSKGYTYLYSTLSTSKKSALTKYLNITKEGEKYLTQAVKRKVRNVVADGVYDPFDDFIVVSEGELDPLKLSRKEIESLHKSKDRKRPKAPAKRPKAPARRKAQ